jgi:hypothetical protein
MGKDNLKNETANSTNTVLGEGFIPKVYIGICKKSPFGKSNINKVWVECQDGFFRSHHSDVVLCKEEMLADEKNNWVKRVL